MEPASSLDAGPSHPYDKLEAQLPSSLLEELFGVTLLIGRLKDLPTNVQSAFNMTSQGKVYKTSIYLSLSFFFSTSNSEFSSLIILLKSFTHNIGPVSVCCSHRFFLLLGICYICILMCTGQSWRFFTCLVTSCKVQSRSSRSTLVPLEGNRHKT